MRLDVDKTWGHRHSTGIDNAFGVSGQVGADLHDPSGLDRDVGARARRTAAVDDGAAAD